MINGVISPDEQNCMDKIKDKLVLEPDFGSEILEEVADIPENVSVESVIDEEFRPLEEEPPVGDTLFTEEIAPISSEFKDPVIITDEYLPPEDNHYRQDALSDESDVSSIAAQIDSLTQVKVVERTPADEDEKLPAVEGADTAPSDEIVINEEDEIDLDYYSLEEISGGSDALIPGKNMPEVDAVPAPDLASRKHEENIRTISQPAGIREEAEAAVPAAVERISASGKTGKSQLIVTHAEEEIEEIPLDADVRQSPADKDNTLTIEIPEDIKERLSDDFDIQELGSIDLKEAEEIANEDVVFLTEDDLIEELEEFDLVPVGKAKTEEAEMAKGVEKIIPKAAGLIAPAGVRKENIREKSNDVRKSKLVHIEETADQEIESAIEAKELHEISEAPLEKISIKQGEEKKADTKPLVSMENERPDEIIPGDEEEIEKEPQVLTEPIIHAKSAIEEIQPALPAEQVSPVIKKEIETDNAPTQKIKNIEKFKKVEIQEQATGKIPVRISTTHAFTKETIPSNLQRLEGTGINVNFIDDDLVEKLEKPEEPILLVSELEKITSAIVEVIEGKAKVLKEADAADDLDKIAGIMRGTTPAFEDLLIDLESEYSFKDDEIDYIDHAFEKEDYGKFIEAIDDYSGTSGMRKVSTAVEILGLDHDEMGLIENNVFFKEYSGIDLNAVRRSPAVGLDQPASDFNILKKCTYILSRPDSLLEEERRDIEKDIESANALLFEEDVNEITKKLSELRKRRGVVFDEGIPDISKEVIIIENETDVNRFIDTIPRDKQESLKKLLKYLDGLFEKLPEDVIKRFADSEYFDIYSKVLNDLGV